MKYILNLLSILTYCAYPFLCLAKHKNGIPLYRTEKGLSYDGVILSRQTMANWLIYCAKNYLSAIYSQMKDILLRENVIHADETTVQVLHEPNREAKTKSYEWLYRTGICSEHHIVIYEYRETRKQDNPREFLKEFKGYMHTDGYQAYHNLLSDVIIIGCWSHCRRYWEKLYEAIKDVNARNGSNAERGLVYINLLFAFEDEFRNLTPEERYEKRLEFSKPVSDDFFDWVGTLNALPKSLLGEAVHYSLSQREYLENVYLDGRLELSNNAAERAIRPFVQGRNYVLMISMCLTTPPNRYNSNEINREEHCYYANNQSNTRGPAGNLQLQAIYAGQRVHRSYRVGIQHIFIALPTADIAKRNKLTTRTSVSISGGTTVMYPEWHIQRMPYRYTLVLQNGYGWELAKTAKSREQSGNRGHPE